MVRVVFAGAHLGYDPNTTPLGGGAQVGLHLIRRWAVTRPVDLVVLGSGPDLGIPGVAYEQVPWRVPGHKGPITDLSVRGYAQLSRQFERGVTSWLRAHASKLDPQETVVLHNDIAEAGDFAEIHRLGFRQAAIFHVDVVDYTAQIYLRRLVSAPALAKAFRALRTLGIDRLLPDVARLIFAKQEACARFCELLIVPSTAMAHILRRSYPYRKEENVAVVPWGAITAQEPPGVGPRVAELREKYGVNGRPVVLTLSRISPEKGQDLVLRALALWEKHERESFVVLICGAPAYMHGQSYMRRLRKLAQKLKKVEVHFPGYVTGLEKHAHLALADLYVFPSWHESYGLTLMEALAAGLPVLTTPHRSAGELVKPSFGRVVEASPTGLYFGLRELLGRREELPRMGQEARRFAQARPFSQAADALPHRLGELVRPTRGELSKQAETMIKRARAEVDILQKAGHIAPPPKV